MFQLRRNIYLDNNATTKVSLPVLNVMNRTLKLNYGNPSSIYKVSQPSAILLEESRATLAKALNVTADEIYFTGSASEANNTILKTLFEKYYPSKKKIITSPFEHPSILNVLDYIKTKGGVVEYLKIDKFGQIDIQDLQNKLNEDTFLVSCMYVNNETGTVFPINEIAKIAHSHNVLMMSDCVQAFGKIDIDLLALQIDYATFSAHKVHGPKGVGALFVKNGCPISPLIHGGHQEKGLRAGTEGIHNIAGFAEAAKNIPSMLKKAREIMKLREYFVANLQLIFPKLQINTPLTNSVPNTINISFPGINNALFMGALDFKGISVSAGSACKTQSNEPSHVLNAIGLTDEQARETLRFSLSDETSLKDIKYVIKVIKEFFNEDNSSINMLSPFQFDEAMLFHSDTYILDVRFNYDRKSIKGLPNSKEVSFFSFKKYVSLIPKDKNIVVICQTGVNSPLIAYYLKKKKFNNLSFLMTGIFGWKLAHPELYQKYAGQNIEILKPELL